MASEISISRPSSRARPKSARAFTEVALQAFDDLRDGVQATALHGVTGIFDATNSASVSAFQLVRYSWRSANEGNRAPLRTISSARRRRWLG